MQKRNLTAGLCALLMACSAGAVTIPVQAAAAENSVSSSMQNYIDQVADLVNQERAKQGLNALRTNPVLNQAAEIRSQEIISQFSHTRPDGRSCATVLDDTGVAWTATGENIAYGYDSPESVMNGWMNSSGHRANILNANFDSIGIGVVSQNGVLYWTQIFTGGTDYDGEYQPKLTPVTIPDKNTDSEKVNLNPDDICIGDSCFTCSGTECTIPQNMLSCLTGNCNTQNVLSCLTGDCSGGNCNTQNILSALNQNCQNGNCNTIQSVLKNFCQ
ncbi:MAG: hypothetical protein IJ642_11865 [Oscillospiraceae bacterium]|nr:hypothetical protein [Oscillospiraceae bacterium]